MRGPQSASSDPRPTGRVVHRFTLEQANKSLPLVRRIVTDIVAAHADAIAAQSRLPRLPAKQQPAAQKDLDGKLERLEDLVEELTEIGCEMKDFTLGLVDFTGNHDGRDVCLCWKLGEEKVGFWHELDEGFAGRQPVATLHETR